MSQCSHICYIVSVLLQPKWKSFNWLVSPCFLVNYNNTQTLEGTWFNSLFSLSFKLTNRQVLICSRHVDADFQSCCYKNMLQNYAANLHKSFPAERSLINSMHASSTTPLIALACFHLLNSKWLLQVVWIPQWYFVTYATRSINIGTFKMFKQSFKIFKPEVLKATSFRRWDETVFQKFCDTYYLSKILFKNMAILTHFKLCAF